MAATATRPSISSPTQLVSQLRSGVTALASTSKHLLQATPDSSLSTGYGLCVGSAYKIASNGVRKARGIAVYASIDQGVVIVNPSTQTAIASHTFSPSVHPITSPIVVQNPLYQSTIICLAPRNQDSSAEVHVWTRNRASPSDDLSEEVHHRSKEISSSARGLHPLISGEILVEHCNGSFSIITTLEIGSLQVQSQSEGSSRKGTKWTHHISVLDRFASATILRGTSRPSGQGLILRFSSAVAQDSPAKRTRNSRKSAIDIIDEVEGQTFSTPLQTSGSGEIVLEIFSVEAGEGEDRIKALSSTNLLRLLQLSDAKEVKDVTLYHSGRVAILTTKSQLLATTLKLTADCVPVLSALTSMNLPLMAQAGQSLTRTSSLQLVSTSTALLIVGRPLEGTMSALLVELDLSCILAESSWTAKGVETTFVHRIAGSTALIIATRGDDSSKLGATLWTLPYEINEGGHLRWALASSALSKKWIGIDKYKESSDDAEDERKQLLKELERIAVDKKDEEAGKATDAAFDKWNKKEIARLEAKWLANVGKEAALDEEGTSDSDTGKQNIAGKGKEDRKRKGVSGKAPNPTFPQLFVSQIVDFALPSATISETRSEAKGYARQTIHHLLTQRVISRSTRPDLMSCLLSVNDWDAIIKALRCVNDLPEQDVVDVLLQVIQKRNNGPYDVRRLESFLNVFASIALNRSQLRIALKNKVEEVDDIMSIFDVLCDWLDRTQEILLEDFYLPDATGIKKKSNKLPQIDHILNLLCDLMDTYFPLFLSTSSTHEYLQRLSKQINTHLTVYNQLLILRGPLAAFSRLEADRKKEAAAASKIQSIDAEEKLTNMRKSNKKAVQGKSNVIGEVGGGTGKGVLGEKSRRRQLYEENVAVGLYSLERLEL